MRYSEVLIKTSFGKKFRYELKLVFFWINLTRPKIEKSNVKPDIFLFKKMLTFKSQTLLW